MSSPAAWKAELRFVAITLLASGVTGWLIGELAPALVVGLLVLLAYWLRQLWRIHHWLSQPQEEPPESRGLWGEVFDSIYHLQRNQREERDRLQTAVSYLHDSFAALKDGVVMIDPRGGIEWCNAAATDLLGLQFPRDKGQSIVNLLRLPAFFDYFEEGDFRQPLMVEGPSDAEIRLKLEITSFGQGSRLLFATDVTRMEQLEVMRRDFVGNVSHELRTPLTVITGYLYTLEETLLRTEPSLEKPLHQMQQQADRMEGLLKDLLLLSRLEALDVSLEKSLVSVAGLAAEVSEEASIAWPGRSVHCDVSALVSVPANYQQLYSALLNLVINALKYSERDVYVSWHEEAGLGYLSVRDEGPGIDDVHLPRLTERFYRVDVGRSREMGGTGLGLAIVKHVLAGHGGRLLIESKPGQGSIFSCVLPLS